MVTKKNTVLREKATILFHFLKAILITNKIKSKKLKIKIAI